MNEQKPPNAIEWTRVRLPDGSRSRGYTWNVITGCIHACQWKMPDGNVAECYAKTVAEGVARASYPQGFEHHYFHPERLEEPLKVKEPAGIFLDSMSDAMGHWVEDAQIEIVLDMCAKAPWHTFFLLTKNAPRLSKFDYPSNVWVGASSPPDWMFGKQLSRHQQEQMLNRTLKTLQSMKARVRWISFEPLSWDCSAIVAQYPGALTWAVIGAASNGRMEFPPAESDLKAMLTVLDNQNVPIFYKGNMRSLPCAAEDWREEFPDSLFKPRNPTPPSPKQTRVVNFHDVKEHWDKSAQQWDSEEYVYIGRPNSYYRLDGSVWANPVKIVYDTANERMAAIDQYRNYIQNEIRLGHRNIEELRGKTLVCWCSPRPCHGDVLLELLGEKPAQQPANPETPKVSEQMSLFGDKTLRGLEKQLHLFD